MIYLEARLKIDAPFLPVGPKDFVEDPPASELLAQLENSLGASVFECDFFCRCTHFLETGRKHEIFARHPFQNYPGVNSLYKTRWLNGKCSAVS